MGGAERVRMRRRVRMRIVRSSATDAATAPANANATTDATTAAIPTATAADAAPATATNLGPKQLLRGLFRFLPLGFPLPVHPVRPENVREEPSDLGVHFSDGPRGYGHYRGAGRPRVSR